MEHAEFPAAAIPGHGQRESPSPPVALERMIGAADPKMEFAVLQTRARLRRDARTSAVRSASPGLANSERNRLRRHRQPQASSDSAATARAPAPIRLDQSTAPRGQQRKPQQHAAQPASSSSSSCSLKRILAQSDANRNCPKVSAGYIQRKGYNLPLWREIAVGSQSRLLSAELKQASSPSGTPGSVMTRTDSKQLTPGTHRGFAALGWHALSQLESDSARGSHGCHAVDRANSSAAATDACR